MVEKLALLPRKLEDPQKPEQVLESLHKHPCRWLSTVFMPLPVLIPCQSQALCLDLCSVSRGGLWSGWFLHWRWLVGQDSPGLLLVLAGSCAGSQHMQSTMWIRPAPAPPKPWIQPQADPKHLVDFFFLKKIREHYQQRTDRQSSSAEWKINWSTKTATCCSCLLSECTTSEHCSAACHDKQSREDRTEPPPAAAPGLKEGFHLLFLVWQETAHLSLSLGNHCGHSSTTTKMSVKAAIWNQGKDWGFFALHTLQKASSPAGYFHHLLSVVSSALKAV